MAKFISAALEWNRRYWFVFALVVLFLIALPGFVLFIINLLANWGGSTGFYFTGIEHDINGWLEDNAHLSYLIPIPWWGAFLLLLVPPLIVLLYFLKLKRKPLQVPSTFLWRKSVEDLHVNSLLQWLRQNVLLLLQLLAILAMIYAIMAFRFHGRPSEGRHYIIMVDNSASMSATDVKPNRLEWAKAEALKEIDSSTDNDFGMVIVFNSSAEIRQSFTSNRDLLRQVVSGIKPTQRVTRIEEALSLAASLANPTRSTENEAVRPAGAEPGKERTYVPAEGRSTEVHLYSDGRFPDVKDFAVGNLNLQLHTAGIVFEITDESLAFLRANGVPETTLSRLLPLKGKAFSNQETVLSQLTEALGKNELEQFKDLLMNHVREVDNIGIVRLGAIRNDADPSKVQVFARVLNYRSKQAKARVQLEVKATGDADRKIYEKEIALPARQVVKEGKEDSKDEPTFRDTPGEATATFDLKDIDERSDVVVHALLLDVKDQFPLDDEAWLVLGVTRKANLLIVTRGNDVLDKFFNEDVVGDVARLKKITPEQLASDEDYLGPAREGAFDLVIFDRCAPAREEDMPRGNTLFIGHPPPGWQKPSDKEAGAEDSKLRPTIKVHNPQIKGWMSKHALLHDLVALQEVGIAEAFRMKDLPPRTPLLIEGDQELPLMLALNRQSFTDVVMTFALLNDKDEWNTLWPLKPSFPLFLRNVLYTMGNVSDVVNEETVQPGQVQLLRPDDPVNEIQVIAPDGVVHALARGTRADFSFGATDSIGVYKVVWKGKVQRSFAVNLLDPDESNLEPRTGFQLGGDEVKEGKTRQQPQEMWKWVVLVALLLLLLEWYIYNRRVYI